VVAGGTYFFFFGIKPKRHLLMTAKSLVLVRHDGGCGTQTKKKVVFRRSWTTVDGLQVEPCGGPKKKLLICSLPRAVRVHLTISHNSAAFLMLHEQEGGGLLIGQSEIRGLHFGLIN
jgi:hypothetical protein